MLPKFSSFAITTLALILNAEAREYMQEKPEFFESCAMQDENFNECFRNNLQNLIINFKDGIPELPAIGKFEPVEVKKLKIRRDQLKVTLRNITIEGLSATNLTKVLHNPTNLSFYIKVNIPKLHIEADYKIIGNVFFVQLNTAGKLWIEAENTSLSFIFKANIFNDTDVGLTFADFQSVKSKIKNIGYFHMQLENLFNGNEELETIIHELLNENWRIVIEFLRPTLESTIDMLVLARFGKVFNYIPAEYFISDIDSITATQSQLQTNVEE